MLRFSRSSERERWTIHDQVLKSAYTRVDVLADALIVVDLLVGMAGATSRLIDTLLVGVSVSDPAAYPLMIAVLAASMLIAAYLAARRAARNCRAPLYQGEGPTSERVGCCSAATSCRASPRAV